MASLAMMLAIQTLHSPLQHLQESLPTARADSGPPALICGKSETSCSHSHQHAHSGLVAHTHTHSHAESCSSSGKNCFGEECPSHSHAGHSHDGHGHSHADCLLCQFLTQSAQPVCLPVLLTGEDVVSAPPVDLLPETVLVPLVGPYVRGPPHLV